ncbi:Trm112 family protein [Saccharolobus solfataricus]|uniref:Trm112 family protein n=2 Tax=Saccharolobus solfataricus TaxID=2287 RepID=A0A0E3MIM6_SACSO|nr:Trm112 family protein [Saccharolobus solfataricus]AKA73532.2 Trm112 family protein [Saccharolobus solfataricus]AKA76230.1 Trm112 family protein [Saccharolobus solfataricus]AKA78922.2 Trm112 family protein [Saccharolobus solfataricus]AZF68001.1 Trm112 family protein [Saccharolobus solfataricus]AZF70621.1 Trm112 family protein [Saccharolobus solfataricus]
MKYRLMDLLACTMCKHFPLKLLVFSEREIDRKLSQEDKKPLCELYCTYKSAFTKDLDSLPPCEECIRHEIEEGMLYCESCNRWYPIIDEIPRMLPDKLRKEEDDIKFLEKYKDKIPKSILTNGVPFRLK